MTKLKLAIRLAWCAIAHDVRQRQGAYRCWVCSPPARKRSGDEKVLDALIAELKADADELEADVNARLGERQC